MKKLVIAAFATLIALPVASLPALAQQVSPGKAALAHSLGLDPTKYTLNELAQIEGEITPGERAARIRYINQQKARGTMQAPLPQAQRQKPSRFLSQRQGIGRNDY